MIALIESMNIIEVGRGESVITQGWSVIISLMLVQT